MKIDAAMREAAIRQTVIKCRDDDEVDERYRADGWSRLEYPGDFYSKTR